MRFSLYCWHLMLLPSLRFELYDMMRDPGQQNDVAKQKPRIVKAMKKDMIALWRQMRGEGLAFQYYPTILWKNEEKITYEENKPKDVRRPGIVGDKGVYSADLFLEEIKKFIKDNKNDPFFLYFPSQVPHGRSPRDGDEVQVPDIGPYADRSWTHLEKLYAAMMTRFDDHVGQIIDLLTDKPLGCFVVGDRSALAMIPNM